MTDAPTPLSLTPLAGPPTQVFALQGDAPATIGRLATCEVVLLDDSVSRRHATLLRRESDWFVIDEGSAGGTFLNGLRIAPTAPVPVSGGDLLRIGPWTFRITTGGGSARSASTIDDSGSASVRVRSAGSAAADPAAEHRLKVLSDCITRLNSAADEPAATRIALASALKGSGFARAALLRRIDRAGSASEVELVDSARADPADQRAFEFSRTLIERAGGGVPVVLTSAQTPVASYGQSIADLDIHSAMCVPLSLGGAVWSYFYLDARGREARVRPDAASFCESLAIAYSLSVASLRRAELERRQAELHAELTAAREVQELGMPPERGSVGCMTYAVRSIPGSFVAGDFFDVTEVPGVGGVAACLGDVAGHGVGSAILMAAAQAYLSAELARLAPGRGPADVVTALNRHLCRRPLGGRFVSLWAGVLRPDGTLAYIDAGHGHWVHLAADGSVVERAGLASGIPIGIDADAPYTESTMTLRPGERVLLYSDGIIEQPGSGGDEFGTARLVQAVAGAGSAADDVARLLGALTAYVGAPVLRDDATAASLSLLDA